MIQWTKITPETTLPRCLVLLVDMDSAFDEPIVGEVYGGNSVELKDTIDFYPLSEWTHYCIIEKPVKG